MATRNIYNGNKSWSQNEDGSPHDDGNNSQGTPPKKILETLKNKKGWDWNKKQDDWVKKCKISLDEAGFVINYPDGKVGYVTVPYNPYLYQVQPYNYQVVDAYLGINNTNTNINNQHLFITVPNLPAITPSPSLVPAF